MDVADRQAESTLRSSAGVSLAVFVSRILGVLRDALFAALFGVSKLTDAFVVAFRIPNLLRDLFAEGALSSAFVPAFADALEKRGRERAYRLGNLVLSGLLVVTGGLSLIGIIYAEGAVYLIAGGVGADPAKLADTTLFARVLMPILVLVSVSAAWMGMLNAQERYLAPAYAPAFFNLVSIACAAGLLIVGCDERPAMLVFCAATTLAGAVQAVAQLPSLRRLGYRPRIVFAGLASDPEVRRILRLMAPATLGVAAVQVNVLVNTYFAAALGDGPLTYLQNAFRLFYLPIGLFGVALATVTTTRLSAEAARGDRGALAARVAEGGRGVWLLALPSAVGLIVLAEPVVALLFERGRFLPEDTRATVPILVAYLLGVVPYSLVKLLSPAFFAIERPRIPLLASVLAVAANLTFNALTYRRLGAAGLALGTTLAALVNLAVLRAAFGRLVGPARAAGWASQTVRLLGANLAMAAVASACWRAGAWLVARIADSPAAAASGLARAAALFAAIAAGFCAYAVALKLLGCRGADEVTEMPARVARRLRRR